MTKIDTSKIAGYADMTAEQKLEALEAYEHEADYSGYVKKDVFDKTASELAAKKKELDAAKTDDERKKAEQEEQFAAISEELTRLKTEKAIANHTAEFLKHGFDDKLAAAAANALQNNDFKLLFESIGKFKENYKTDVLSKEFGNTPKPEGGKVKAKDDKSEFAKYQENNRPMEDVVDLKK